MDPSEVNNNYTCPTNPDYIFDQTTNDTASPSTSASQDSDETQPIEVLKKNLADEEEFHPVDQKGPIQIFLKVKPLTALAMADQHLYEFHGETGVSVRPPTWSLFAKNKNRCKS